MLKLDTLELFEVGYRLVGLVDAGQGRPVERIAAIRRQLAAELGFVLPPVRIRDNMQLGAERVPNQDQGRVVAKGRRSPGKLLAMDSGIATGRIEGQPTREPAFGLDAWWVDPSLKTKAETMNFTVVDATSVLATHLTEVVKLHAGELLTREEVHNLITQLKEKGPKLVEVGGSGGGEDGRPAEGAPEPVAGACRSATLDTILRDAGGLGRQDRET